MKQDTVLQYSAALKAGQRYVKEAAARGEDPYPAVLDELLEGRSIAGQRELGLVDIPSELIVGTTSAGRVAALAGNFMPILDSATEFGMKWMSLCDAHLGDEGIRDPIQCQEYMGRFYVREGNKRVSVLRSFGAPTVPGLVTRLIPARTDEERVKQYYEFMDFYALSGLYGVEFTRPGSYARLQAALGMEKKHIWTEEERRSFRAGFSRFSDVFESSVGKRSELNPAEALLVWLQIYPFSAIKELSAQELGKKLTGIWPDVLVQTEEQPITVSTLPGDKEKGLLSKLRSIALPDHLNIAFIYAYSPETSPWTRAHDEGRLELERKLGEQVSVRVYRAYNHDYDSALQRAAEEGAELIFATTPAMIGACRKLAAAHKGLRILNCALSQPYTGVRMYYSRIHEVKFITGAIAGVMSEGDEVGYVANYPIYGVPVGINAFALGLRMTNPRGRVRLDWSCLPGDPVERLVKAGVRVISNRDFSGASYQQRPLDPGTYRILPDGQLQTLASSCWNWGRLYERIVRSIFSGAWEELATSESVNYWWGMDSGVIDVALSPELPEGVRALGQILKSGFCSGTIQPFAGRILDQSGQLRNDGSRLPDAKELMKMDWLCENVDGGIPAFEELLPMSRELVRRLGLYRDSLPPEKEGPQL